MPPQPPTTCPGTTEQMAWGPCPHPPPPRRTPTPSALTNLLAQRKSAVVVEVCVPPVQLNGSGEVCHCPCIVPLAVPRDAPVVEGVAVEGVHLQGAGVVLHCAVILPQLQAGAGDYMCVLGSVGVTMVP